MIGVSGVLSPHEGDMAVAAQPQQLSNCWSAAACYFGVGEWWSLAWGARPLAQLAEVLHAPPSRRGEYSLVWAMQVRPLWGECYDAAKAAGERLFAQLRGHECGARPASLLGVSLGARVVWHCLERLAALPPAEGGGLVQDVVLLAAPVTVNSARWEKVSAVVAGRLINAYVPGNVQLGALYRTDHLTSQGCCGLTPVQSACVENYDATEQVAADSDSYHFALPAVLESVGLFPSA